MIRNVVFDLGGVLIGYQPLAYLRGLGYSDAVAEEIHRCVFASREWLMLDEGTLSHPEATRLFQERLPALSAEIGYVMEHYTDMMQPIEPMIQLLDRLRTEGYRLYYLSNIHGRAADYLLDSFSFLPLFDGGVFSYLERVIKPDPAIYRRLLERYDLDAEACLFIDDTPRNVVAAREVGMHAIRMTTPEETIPLLMDALHNAAVR